MDFDLSSFWALPSLLIGHSPSPPGYCLFCQLSKFKPRLGQINMNKLVLLCMVHGIYMATVFLAFVHLPLYCVYTWFLRYISSFLSFFTFSHALHFSILPLKHQSQMTNPHCFQIACMTSSR